MHVFMFVPAFGQIWNAATVMTTHSLRDACAAKGINTSISTLSFPDIAELRSMVATIWYDTMPESDYLLFIDSDMGFAPDLVMNMILFGEPLVGAIYRQRKEPVSWAGSGTGNVASERRGGFMHVEGVGMGCTMIKREVITKIIEKYPELVDMRIDLHPAVGIIRTAGANRLIRCFEKMDIPDRGVVSEDLSFCIRWNSCGGKVWAAIDQTISHVGMHDFQGNYLQHIMAHQAQAQATMEMQAKLAMEMPPMQVLMPVQQPTEVVAVQESVAQVKKRGRPRRNLDECGFSS